MLFPFPKAIVLGVLDFFEHSGTFEVTFVMTFVQKNVMVLLPLTKLLTTTKSCENCNYLYTMHISYTAVAKHHVRSNTTRGDMIAYSKLLDNGFFGNKNFF